MTAYEICYQFIQDDVNRPDLEEVIKRRIQRAVLKFHRMDFWKRDFVEQPYAFVENVAGQVIDLRFFSRLRAIGYMRKATFVQATNVYETYGSHFTEMNPMMTFDGYGYDRTNTFYRQGDQIKLLSSEALQYMMIGWFQDPLLEPIIASDSWILRDFTSLIVAEVTNRIFKDIGKDSEAASKKEEVTSEVMLLQINATRVAVLQA